MKKIGCLFNLHTHNEIFNVRIERYDDDDKKEVSIYLLLIQRQTL
jgi:hypothetical protein